MNKKFVFLLFTGLLVLIIIFSIAAYRYYLAPVYEQNDDQLKTVVIGGQPKKVEFSKKSSQGDPFSLELEVEGKTKEHFTLILSNPKQAVHTVRIKGGNVDFSYVNDWYEDKISTEIIPEKGENGKLTLKCRFITI